MSKTTQTVELTSKRWKGLYAIGALLVFISVGLGVGSCVAFTDQADGEGISMAQAGWLLTFLSLTVIGFMMMCVAKVCIWWFHE